MAKKTNKVSFSKAILDKNEDKYIITEISKDDSKSYNLTEIIDKFIGVEGISLTIGVDDEIQPIDED